MARKFTVTLTSGTDQGPYNIYYDSVSVGTLADLFGTSNKAENLTLSQVQSGVVIEVPDNANKIIFFNTNPDVAKDCPTNQEIFTLSSQPTSTPIPNATPNPTPTPTSTNVPPTPTPTEDATCNCYEFNNTTKNPVTYFYVNCSGESVTASSSTAPWVFYVCAQSITGVENEKLAYSLYGSCTDGVCDNMPTPTPTDTPIPTSTPTPTPTADNVQVRNLKFAHCNTIEDAAASEEVGTQNVGPSEPPIYLTTDEYGSNPTIGDTVLVRLDGESSTKCYQYMGLETGSAVILTIINASCNCPSLEPTPTSTDVEPTPIPTQFCVDVEFNGKSETAGGTVTYEGCDGNTYTLSVPGGDTVQAPRCVRNSSWTYSIPNNFDPATLLVGDCASGGSSPTPTPIPTRDGGPIASNTYYLSAGRPNPNDFCEAPGYTATLVITSSASSIGNMLNTTIYDFDGDPYVGNELHKHFVTVSQGENSTETIGNPEYIVISDLGQVTDVGQMCGPGDGENPYSEPINPTPTSTE